MVNEPSRSFETDGGQRKDAGSIVDCCDTVDVEARVLVEAKHSCEHWIAQTLDNKCVVDESLVHSPKQVQSHTHNVLDGDLQCRIGISDGRVDDENIRHYSRGVEPSTGQHVSGQLVQAMEPGIESEKKSRSAQLGAHPRLGMSVCEQLGLAYV